MAKTIYDLLHESTREYLSHILCDHFSDCRDCPGKDYCHPRWVYDPAEHGGEPYHNGLWHFLGRPAEELFH